MEKATEEGVGRGQGTGMDRRKKKGCGRTMGEMGDGRLLPELETKA